MTLTLDTSAYSQLARGESQITTLLTSAKSISISLPVIAELRFGFAHGSKQQVNETKLQRFLANDNVDILLPTINTTDIYASLATFCKKAGRILSHNDIWIAALAQENAETLITYDTDFEALIPKLKDQLIIIKGTK